MRGNDVVYGGNGFDLFCIAALGSYTIEDFNPYQDQIYFDTHTLPYKNYQMLINSVLSANFTEESFNINLVGGVSINFIGYNGIAPIDVNFFSNFAGAFDGLLG